MDYDHIFKIMVIGEQSVGKTAIMTRYCDDTFSPIYISTFGVDFKSKKIDVNGKQIKIQVWDTAGQERFNTIIPSYYRGASGIFLVFDLTKIESFKRVSFWMENIKQYANSGIEVILLGNKADLKNERMLTSTEVSELAKSFDISYYETSAKSNINIEEAFFEMSRTVFSKLKNEPIENKLQILSKTKTKKCSCYKGFSIKRK